MRAKFVNESIITDKKETKNKKESYKIIKNNESIEIQDSDKNVIKSGSSVEMIFFLTDKGGMSNINAKFLIDNLNRGDLKVKIFIANPKIFEDK